MQSRATAQWEGDLLSGKGRTSAASGTFDAGLSWKAGAEGAASMTTPEEVARSVARQLLLDGALARPGRGRSPLSIETSCVVEFGPKRGADSR
jgi:lipoyl-dependent peroxiredoxin